MRPIASLAGWACCAFAVGIATAVAPAVAADAHRFVEAEGYVAIEGLRNSRRRRKSIRVCFPSSTRTTSIVNASTGDDMRSRAFEFSRACLLALAATWMMSACTKGSSSAGSTGASQTRAAPAALPPGTEWAAWINRDIQIDLPDLPHTYTCDELWYKLHAILLAIGAREYMAIDRYNCGKGPSGGRSPTLHLRFFTLRPVTGDQIRWANTRATEKAVILAPGEPNRLEPGDCALVQQLQGTLLAYLDVQVSTARFECSSASAHDFELSARVLKALPEKPATP